MCPGVGTVKLSSTIALMKTSSRRRGFAREAQRVADVVGNVLHLGALVVVREDDGVVRAGERADPVVQRSVGGVVRCGHAEN